MTDTADSGNLGASHPQESALEEKKLMDSAAPAEVQLATREGFQDQQAVSDAGVLHFLVPNEWEKTAPGGSMRLLQLSVPGEAGAGELVVFYFGPNSGTIQMNIDRWIGQFSQPDGSDSKDKAIIEEIEGDHHTTTFFDLSGTMAASNMPGMPSTEEQANYRMLAAVIKTPAGPWYITLKAPEATAAAQREAFLTAIKSAQFAG
jgi:hypothetical protein